MIIQGRVGRFKIFMWEDWSGIYYSLTVQDYEYCTNITFLGLYLEYSVEKLVYSVSVALMGFNINIELMPGNKKDERYKQWVEADGMLM